jgi:UDP-2,3-diacylglucosamine hydrolase
VNKKTETLFVSDLHLDVSRPNITSIFLDFLQHSAAQAETLYILGDLFEVWIGDDNSSELNQEVTTGLYQLAQKGTPIHLMHGNRDFLIGQEFASSSGSTLIQDPTIIDLYGTPTLLLHGDTLCTDDKDYMDFRTLVRDPEWQESFLSKSLEERKEIARELREESSAKTQKKSEVIMDVNQQAVEQKLKEYDVDQMIHGHTHRPNTHKFLLNGKPAQRIVLGDWYQAGSVLRCTSEGCKLETLNSHG